MPKLFARLLAFACVFVLFGSNVLAQNGGRWTSFRVVDGATHQRALDATVTVAGRVLVPSADGSYSVPASTQMIAARAPGYRAVMVPMASVAGSHEIALTPFAIHALYLSEYGISSSTLRDSAFSIIRRGGANALVINIKSDHGLLVYPSQIPLAAKVGARSLTLIKSLSQLVQMGHAQGIYMIARIVTFKDTPLATQRPDLALHTADGKVFFDHSHLAWTDPWKQEVRNYNIAIAVEAAKAGFDEIQFDYVRFPDSTAKLISSGPTDEAGRIQAITSFLAAAHQALAPYNVFQSADIFGYTFWNTNDTGIGQQLDHLVNTVDYLCPMLYPSGFHYGIPGHPQPLATSEDIYNTIKLSLDNGLRRTHTNPKKLRPWLQAFRDYAFNHQVFGPEQVAVQIRAADQDDTDGWQLWNPRNVYTGLDLGQQSPFRMKLASFNAESAEKKR